MARFLTDAEIVRDAQEGDLRARDELMDLALPQVLAWCRRLGGPRVDAEDAAHDALITALTRLDDLRDPDAFPSWLYGITRRTLAGHRRRAFVRRWVPGAPPEVADPGPSPAAEAELSETARRVQAALEALPPRQREVLVLHDLEERSDSEVAELLDVPKGTVKSRLRLARSRFRSIARQRELLPPLAAAERI